MPRTPWVPPTQARSLSLSSRTQVVCAWTSIVCILLSGLAFVIADFIPPPKADASAQDIADFYANHTGRIRAGLLLMFISWAGWGTLVACIATQMQRIEGVRPIMTNILMLSGGAAWMFVLLPTIVLTVAAYRPERSPEITQTLHDLDWISAFFPFLVFAMFATAMAVAIFQDPGPNPVFPRWLAYVNIWAEALFIPAAALIFFHSGVFSYHGMFPFWIPLLVFGGWVLLLAWAVRQAALNEMRTS
ncbi:hypothetical protein [Sporichthya sp.]|uniref:hypothetical protein n=1 Tax=Sporichthya sp. TaxID=65475 RepID=UPI0018004319|nr:hypothetical protein [Sporichthya sp.]MBA3741880.1 hypothetical protein [Sporichthya sp.]